MAIFLFFAWVMELAEKVGIIKEDESPRARSYRAANHCMHVLKQELYDVAVASVEASKIKRADGSVVACHGHRLWRDDHELADLGAGEVLFGLKNDTVEARIVGCVDEGRYTVTVWIPVVLGK